MIQLSDHSIRLTYTVTTHLPSKLFDIIPQYLKVELSKKHKNLTTTHIHDIVQQKILLLEKLIQLDNSPDNSTENTSRTPRFRTPNRNPSTRMLVTEEVKLPMTENTTHTSGSHSPRCPRYSTTSMLSKVVVATEVQPMTKIINKTCIFCKGFHYSDQCSKYNSLESRKQAFKARCY
uniref:Uncharacterized protein n=1 Tax=Cacopsylla melanoneura TaxID=428564 RepID=A0A8D9BGY7_9HEMI